MGKSAKQTIRRYRMSMHIGIAVALDSLDEILVGDKVAWAGQQTTEGAIQIDKPNLFGGPKKEGGVAGVAYYLPGAEDQVLPEGLAARLEIDGQPGTSATRPGFRQYASIFFVNTIAAMGSHRGFMWTEQNPYLKAIKLRCTRISRNLSNVFATLLDDDGKPTLSNPAHYIYECLTDPDWGMGGNVSVIDVASFMAAAETFYNEEYGIALAWMRQNTIEAHVTDLLAHVNATLFVHPATGLITIKPVRGDYDPDDLPVLTIRNSNLSNFQRKTLEDTVNHLTVTFTNHKTEEDDFATLQDNGNAAAQGGVVPGGVNYHAFRRRKAALQACARQLRVGASPLCSMDVETNMFGWRIVPGDCVKVIWEEHGLNGTVMRVGECEYGEVTSGDVRMSLIEDVFGYRQVAYTVPTETHWESMTWPPAAIPYARVSTLPYYFVVRSNVVESPDAMPYPGTVGGVLASTAGKDTFTYELMGPSATPTGGSETVDLATSSILGRGTLLAELDFEAISAGVVFTNLIGGIAPGNNVFVFIGAEDVTDEEMEIALIASSGPATWTLWRGVLDTVPKAWPANTPVFFINADTNFDDETVREEGETVSYRALAQTSLGIFPFEDAADITGTLSARPQLPSRPANVKVEGIGNGEVVLPGGTTDFTVTWANRNRTLEDPLVLKWDEGDTPPEVGQTTTIRFFDLDDNFIADIDGLTGTSYDVSISALAGFSVVKLQVIAKRDGLESLQGHSIIVRKPVGRGQGYGFNYGGA